MSLEQVWDKLRVRAAQPLTEVHVVNGLHPDLPFDYYTDMLRGFKRIRPVHSPEVLHGRRDRVLRRALRHDRRAGAARAAGGGARLAARRRRRDLRRARPAQDRARQVRTPIATSTIHKLAHGLGMRTNVTMLYGHIETAEERVDHMLRARALQDETGGLQAFIPLAFHPDNNQMRKLPAPSGVETLRVLAVVAADARQRARTSRASGLRPVSSVAQMSLWFGVSDLDGTVQEERIYHMAGSDTPEAMTTSAIRRLIRAAGREPIERDTLYNVVTGPRGCVRAATWYLTWQQSVSAKCREQVADSAVGCRQSRASGCAKLSTSGDSAWVGPRGKRMDIKLLTQVEKAEHRRAPAAPERYLRLSDDEMDARIAAGEADAGRAGRDSRAPLSARRGDQVRRLHRRLAEAVARSRQPRQGGVHRLLRRALHGRERRHPARAAPESRAARPRRRLLDGRHGCARSARDLLARAERDGRRHRRHAGTSPA